MTEQIQCAQPAQAERVAKALELLEEAFFDGFGAVETYNDTRLNNASDTWKEMDTRYGYSKRLAAILEAAQAVIQAPEGAELPLLPHPLLIAGGGQAWYSTDQMLAYARAALVAQPAPGLHAAARHVVVERERYGWSPEADKAIYAMADALKAVPAPAEAHGLSPLPDPKYIYHNAPNGEDDLFVFAESGDVGCEHCERLYTAEQMRAYAASNVQPKGMVEVPDGLSRSDAEFWLRHRSSIIDALRAEGLSIVSTAHGVRLMRLGKIEAQAATSTQAPAPGAALPGDMVLVPRELLKDAAESVDDYRAGVEFGSCDRKLLGRLKAASGQPKADQQMTDEACQWVNSFFSAKGFYPSLAQCYLAGKAVAPSPAVGDEARELMSMTEAQIDDELRAMGIDPATAAQKGGEAVANALQRTGGYVCGMCGKDQPHEHTPDEVVIFRNGLKRGAAQAQPQGSV